ncbi:MAG: efflux RND transporter permease subunit [Prolixibacteraceae bacterium]|nr:efflux RND transporter permease subunit [Prolixibacteraceae bacterium]
MRFIIDRKVLISMLFIGLTLLGIVSYKQLNVELLPNVDLPFLYVQATSSSGDVDLEYFESEVIIPLEEAIGTMSNIESVESTIRSNRGTIVVYYRKNVNFNLAYLKLQEKINTIKGDIPDDFKIKVNRVDLTQMNNQFMTLQAIGSDGVDRVRNVVDLDVTTDLENIDGIAGVSVFGGQEKTIEIDLNEEKCKAYNITAAKIRSLISQNSQSRTYVGNLKEKDKLYFVHVSASYDKVSDIENLVLADGPVLLKDVAEVKFGEKESTSYSRVDGKSAVSLRLVNDSQSNQIKLSHKVLQVVANLNKKLKSQDVQLILQSNSAETMENNINQIINLAVIGGLLAIFVLWIFLKNIRLVMFIALAIPISVYTAFNLFYAYDISLNSLTLVGMALAIGMLLDNSVVVLENIYRLAGKGENADDSVVQGTKEVWRSVVASTLTTITVFLPFLFSDNYLIEMLGKNVGVSIISTLFVSLIVALLLIPSGIHFILKRNKGKTLFFEKMTTDNRMMQIYILLLKTSLRHPLTTILGAVLLFFLTIAISLSISVDSLKEVTQNQISVSVTMPSGSTLETTNEMVQKIEDKLKDIAEKDHIYSNVEEEEATVTVKLVDDYEKINDRSYAEIKSEINGLVNNMSPASIEVNESSGSTSSSGGGGNMANNFQKLLGVGTNSESIEIKGENFAAMQRVAEDLKYYLENMDIINRVRVNVSDNSPEVHMIFDPLIMTDYGITTSDVSSEINSFTKEFSTGVVFNQGDDEYDIMIKQYKNGNFDTEDVEDKRTMDELKGIRLEDTDNGFHELQDFTRLFYSRGLSSINRENQEKIIRVTYSFDDNASESKDILTNYRYQIDNLVAGYQFPSGVTAEVVHEEQDLSDFYFLIFAAIILIFMILASVFESFFIPFVLLFSIPLAAIGSLIALIITGNSLLNSNTLIGFLILLGIVVNNGIILIDYTNILRKKHNYRRSRALMTAGLSRVRPILITAITTIVAMIPLAMGNAEYVSVIGAPFAIVVIGGLSLSTLLTLVFVPTLYSGMENAIFWFKQLDIKLRILQFVIMLMGFILIYLEVDSLLWEMADVVLVVVLIPGITWFLMNSLKKAGTKLIDPDEPVHIQIRNLVKIYDRPGRFSREWNGGLNMRKRKKLVKEYRSVRDFDQMIWQLPLLGFLIYFSFFYINTAFWNCIIAIVVYMYVRELWKSFYTYLHFKYKDNGKLFYDIFIIKLDKGIYWVLPFIELLFLYFKTSNLGLIIIFAVIWYLGLVISTVSRHLYEEKVNINRITGRFGSLRRSLFRIVERIPVISKRNNPFKALNGVSLDIHTGMFGLLGPNGAGKSTMMRIICGIFEQSYGKILINGIDTQEKREELQGYIGYLPQEFGMYENMSSWDYLEYQSLLKGIKDDTLRKERIKYVLEAVHMEDHANEKIGSFSGGMKQRIGIAQILLHLPKILVVDEPTAGLDPRERIHFRNLLVELSRERIVIFSTHIIEDISSSCNQVAVVIHGKVKYNGSISEMVYLAENLVWQFEMPAKEFDNLPDKQMVIYHMMVGDNVRIRMIAKEKPMNDAVPVTPLLEDAYLCLIKNIK